jgi:hypothetical protein
MTNRDEPTAPAALPPEKLYTACDTSSLRFVTTDELEPMDSIVGQDRAIAAIRFAIGMRHDGYNLFALGAEGSGRHSVVRQHVAEAAAAAPVPSDWCYVHNFAEAHLPVSLELPPGRGCALRTDMERLVEDLRAAVPAAFEAEEYRNRRSALEETFKEENDSAFGALQQAAQKKERRNGPHTHGPCPCPGQR